MLPNQIIVPNNTNITKPNNCTQIQLLTCGVDIVKQEEELSIDNNNVTKPNNCTQEKMLTCVDCKQINKKV